MTQLAFVLVCLLVRQELGPGAAIDELVLLKVIRATIAAVLLVGLGGVLIAQVPLSDTVIIAWLVVPLIGGRSSVRLWSAVIGAEPLTGSPHRLPRLGDGRERFVVSSTQIRSLGAARKPASSWRGSAG